MAIGALREELEAEIDRLYTAKTSADNEADAVWSSKSTRLCHTTGPFQSFRSEANLPRSEMAAFLVEFYLEQLEPETFDDRRVNDFECFRISPPSAALTNSNKSMSFLMGFRFSC